MRTPLYGLAWISAFITSVQNRPDTKHDERGAAFTEYVVLVALVVAGVALVLAALWPKLTAAINGLVIP